MPGTKHGVLMVVVLTSCISLFGLLVLAGCGGTRVGVSSVERYNQEPYMVNIPVTLTPKEVQEVMVTTLQGRQWAVVEQSPQAVVGKLDHRSFQAKVTLKAESGMVKILSDSYYKSEDGQREPGVPLGWLKNLQADLRTRFTRKAAQK